MIFRLHAARQALKLGLVLGAFSTLAGFGQLADAGTGRASGSVALRAASPALALAPVEAPRTAAATGSVELPPGAAGEPGRARMAQTVYDFGQARRMNAAMPFSRAPILAAAPFTATGSAGDRARAETCMTQAIYYEAGFEPTEGQRAVAQVIINRMRHPIFPHSICGVVFQGAELATGCQFSFSCDGALGRGVPAPAAWKRAQAVARAALNGYVEKAVGLATHYHTEYVAPYWMTTVTKMARVGQHIFYRWPGVVGLPSAFSAQYAAAERPPSATVLLAAARVRAAEAAARAGSPLLRAFLPGQGVSMGPDGAIYVAQKEDDGRVHARLFTDAGLPAAPAEDASAGAATPTARRAALLSGHGGDLPTGLETVTPAKPAAAAPAASAAAAPAGESAAGES